MDDYIKVYAYLDIENSMAAAWGVMRGMLISPIVLEMSSEGKGFLSFMTASILSQQEGKKLFNEALIEEERASVFPDKASRLRGLYFFENKNDAIKAEKWGYHFIEDNFSEILIPPNLMLKYTKVDSNWITYAELDDEGVIKDRTWIRKYWEGKPYNENPIWEIIFEGVAIIPNEGIRRQAEKNVRTWFPESDFFILAARLASEVGSFGGVITPYLIHNELENSLKIEYIFRDEELHSEEIIEKMAKHPDFGKLAKIMKDNESYIIPDFNPWVRTINAKESHIVGIRSNLKL